MLSPSRYARQSTATSSLLAPNLFYCIISSRTNPNLAYYSTALSFWSPNKSTTKLLRSSTTPKSTKSNYTSTHGVIHASFRLFPPEIRRNVSADLMLYIAWPTSNWKSGILLSGTTKMQRPPSMPLDSVAARVGQQGEPRVHCNRVIFKKKKRRGLFCATSMKMTLMVSFAQDPGLRRGLGAFESC